MNRVKNQLKTFLLLGALSALLVAIGSALGEGWTLGALALAVVLNVGAYFFSDRVVLAIQRARAVTPGEAPELHAMVDDLARRAGIPKPRVFIVESPQPNAFATGRNPKHGVVAVTTGILSTLTPRELRGVLAHEIGHIKGRDVLLATVAATVAAAITYLAHGLQLFAFTGGSHDDDGPSPAAALVLALFAPLLAMLMQLGVSRSREFAADAEGARICEDPEALASALVKLDRAAHVIPAAVEPATASLFIVNPLGHLRARAVRLFSTHPSTEERVERLMAMTPSGGRPRWSQSFAL